ncbi:MAG: aminoacetone oxidase family FAD-binding enzyme, partial [Cyanobacteria bacterium]|nr:aminoacetone oxidase family FAD-binding enzyme [Cyanobacteriota bacterium]
MMETPRLIVVGGGAAGFFGAIQAKTMARHAQVTILEAAPKVLGKVKISGGGRCNVTHACFDPAQLIQYYPRNPKALRGQFQQFGPQETVQWFESRGVELKTEADGRMFPVSDLSQTIIDCLRESARSLGIQVLTATKLESIEKTEAGFRIKTLSNSHPYFESEYVLIASGSAKGPLLALEAMGHSIIPQVPSLFTFNIKDPLIAGLAGVSFPSAQGFLIPTPSPDSSSTVSGKSLGKMIQEGPLLITHWGLSGPLILKLSAWGARFLHQENYHAPLGVDFLPDLSREELRALLIETKEMHAKKWVQNVAIAGLPKRFWENFVHNTQGIASDTQWGELPNKKLNQWVELLKGYPFKIQGKGPFKEEFVTAGGVPLNEIHLKRMESKIIPGLFL